MPLILLIASTIQTLVIT
ncbi:hypothetical protein A2U01_0113767, partial [Trifolium medium]|nr:hypothetical protein [Trifolium medium]